MTFEWAMDMIGFLFFVLLCLCIISLIIGILRLICETVADWFGL